MGQKSSLTIGMENINSESGLVVYMLHKLEDGGGQDAPIRGVYWTMIGEGEREYPLRAFDLFYLTAEH